MGDFIETEYKPYKKKEKSMSKVKDGHMETPKIKAKEAIAKQKQIIKDLKQKRAEAKVAIKKAKLEIDKAKVELKLSRLG